MTGPTLACWIDLETTGPDQARGHVLEVAAIVTTADAAATEVARLDLVIAPAEWDGVDDLAAGVPPGSVLPPELGAMHSRSGLLDAVTAAPRRTRRDVDQQLLEWRLDVCDAAGASRTMLLAGSGVAHFESRWIPAHFPRFAAGLTWWTLDTGVVARALRLTGHDIDTARGRFLHRALADVEDHLDEWRRLAVILTP